MTNYRHTRPFATRIRKAIAGTVAILALAAASIAAALPADAASHVQTNWGQTKVNGL